MTQLSEELPIIYLARHGETAWSLTGQHTGLTDLPLTERGERNARRLQERLRGLAFISVLTSPLLRARRSCELAGFASAAEVVPDLVEWDYGEYEGQRSVEAVSGNVLLFSSGHFLRMLAARWCQVEPITNARSFMLDTASLSALGYEKSLSHPVIRLWNDTHHLRT